MNILLVTMEMNIGGAETHVLELATVLTKRGNDVYVVSAGGKLVSELEANGVKHIYAPLKDKKISHVFESAKTIKSAIKEHKIDIVHAHARIPGAICGVVCKKTKTHFVTTIHGTYKVNPLLKLLTNWGEKTLAVSEDIMKYAINEYNLKPENVFLTVNGINVEKFKKKDVTDNLDIIFDEKKKTVIHTSRLDKESSQIAEMLIEISGELDKSNIQIIIIGAGNNYDNLQKKAKDCKNVIFTGARTDVDKILNIGNIFVGVSRAALEAMACELPVILAGNEAYGQGYQGIFGENSLELAQNTNFTCRELEKVDKEMLKNDILTLLNEPIHEMGKYNRKVVEESYSVEKMANDAMKLYKF